MSAYSYAIRPSHLAYYLRSHTALSLFFSQASQSIAIISHFARGKVDGHPRGPVSRSTLIGAIGAFPPTGGSAVFDIQIQAPKVMP